MNKSEIKVIHDKEWQSILSKARNSLTNLDESWRIEHLAGKLCDFSKKYSSYEETGFKHVFYQDLGKFNLGNDVVQIKNLNTPYGKIPFIEVHLSTLTIHIGASKYSYSIIASDTDNPEIVDVLYTRDPDRTYDAFSDELKEVICNYVKILNTSVRHLINQ